MAVQHNPPHPGAILREDVLPALGLSVTEAARQLGVSRVTLSRLIHEQANAGRALAPIWPPSSDISFLINRLAIDSVGNPPENAHLGTIIASPGGISGLGERHAESR